MMSWTHRVSKILRSYRKGDEKTVEEVKTRYVRTVGDAFQFFDLQQSTQ